MPLINLFVIDYTLSSISHSDTLPCFPDCSFILLSRLHLFLHTKFLSTTLGSGIHTISLENSGHARWSGTQCCEFAVHSKHEPSSLHFSHTFNQSNDETGCEMKRRFKITVPRTVVEANCRLPWSRLWIHQLTMALDYRTRSLCNPIQKWRKCESLSGIHWLSYLTMISRFWNGSAR